ncbi:MAG: CopG family ribbon-helix-helix protein [Candidatus Bathyarchaeia archaeon]
MPIITVSVNDVFMREMSQLQTSLGFSGRSELVRAAVRSLIAEERERSRLEGRVYAVLMVSHDEQSEEIVTRIKHDHDELVITHVHSKLDEGRCLEIFILKGEADRVREMTNGFQASRKMERVRLSPM